MIEDLKKLRVGRIETNIDLKKYCTYKVGGIGKVLVIPDNEECLVKLIKYIKENKIKYKILGNGSNLIFSDFDGILIKLEKFDYLDIKDTIITVGAGYSLARLAIKASKLGLTGLEFATGIPGTVGGAVYMNAGAYKSDMGYIVSEVKVLTEDLQIKKFYNKDINYHYRESIFQHGKYVILEAKIVLKHGNKDEIMDIIENRKQRRLMSQPLEYPSAGSVFRNPDGDFAGRLIEEIGYKGKIQGGAMVSDKHANFIINYKDASYKDVIKLINDIKKEVKEKYNIDLKCEQEIVE